MNWLAIAILSYFLNALAVTADKFLVTKKMPNPFTFSFYIGIMSIFAIFFVPFGFSVPPTRIILTALASGAIFLASLVLFFVVLFRNEASRVPSIVGALTPIFSFGLSSLFLGENLTILQFAAFFILIIGGFALMPRNDCENCGSRDAGLMFFSAFLMAISFVLSKFVYLSEPFISGFIWTRLGSVLAAVLLLVFPSIRRSVFEAGKGMTIRLAGLIAGNKAIGGAAFILLNLAISRGEVSLVNAARGVEFAFVFIFTFFLSCKFPNILKEEISRSIIIRKILAIAIIGAGLALLAI